MRWTWLWRFLVNSDKLSGSTPTYRKAVLSRSDVSSRFVDNVNMILPWTEAQFPCFYLGLPISDWKLRKSDLLLGMTSGPHVHIIWVCFILSPNEDSHSWSFETSGVFITKSVYRAFFHGSINFEPWRWIWKTWAPLKCEVFLWLAVWDSFWTTNHLAKQNLPHPSQCLLCDQAEETIQHLLTCVFAHECWFWVLPPLGLQHGVPSLRERNFAEWWRRASKRTAHPKRTKRKDPIHLWSCVHDWFETQECSCL
jgi:hypothetical protein